MNVKSEMKNPLIVNYWPESIKDSEEIMSRWTNANVTQTFTYHDN